MSKDYSITDNFTEDYLCGLLERVSRSTAPKRTKTLEIWYVLKYHLANPNSEHYPSTCC